MAARVPRSTPAKRMVARRSPIQTRRPAPPFGLPVSDSRSPYHEVDTAARLDAVLGIAGRLAASHDREELFRTIVDETNRALHCGRDDDPDPARRSARDRRLGRHVGRHGRAAARARPGRRVGRRGPAHRPGRRLVRYPGGPGPGVRTLRRRLRIRRLPHRAADPSRPRAWCADHGDARAASLDERRHRVRQHAGDPRRHRPDQRRAVRADGDARRPARDAPGGLRPDEPGRHGRRGRSDGGRRDPADGRLPQRQGLSPRAAGPRRADRLRGLRRSVRAGRHGAPLHAPRRRFYRLGGPAR